MNQSMERGRVLEIFGWGTEVQVGDFLILRDRTHKAKYRVDDIRYESPFMDLWWATVKFVPSEKK